MEKGRIIFLNGVTSAGKTSIVEALQDREDVFFYVVANDLFQEMVGERYLRDNYWKYLSEVIIMMYHSSKLYSDMGKNVIIDGILVEREELKPHYHTSQREIEIHRLGGIEMIRLRPHAYALQNQHHQNRDESDDEHKRTEKPE